MHAWFQFLPKFLDKRIFLSSLLLSSAFVGCSRKESPANFLARVGDEVLTEESLSSVMRDDERSKKTMRDAYIQSWVNETMLFQEAVNNNVTTGDKFTSQMEDFRRQLAVRTFLEQTLYLPDDTLIEEARMVQYFQAHHREFNVLETAVQLSGIIFPEKKDANRFRTEFFRGVSWQQLIKTFSADDKGKKVFENTIYLRQTLFSPEIWNVALTLKPNEISFPVQTSLGYAVVRLLDIQKKGEPSRFAFVRNEIRQRIITDIRQRRYEQYIKSLNEKYQPEISVGGNSPSLPQ
ncbi:MAG: peptidyl-prolyl cis-trans isomerase [Ignavibacteriales bacterium]|nr:peptidyl-prolyl cis-trans isomerase [Ignavibacteriales bacterium]